MCGGKKEEEEEEADGRPCVIKAPPLEHMLARTNIHARHSSAIRGGFQALVLQEGEGTGLRGAGSEKAPESSSSPNIVERGLIRGPGRFIKAAITVGFV